MESDSCFEGCIYGETPTDPHYRLTVDDLRNLQLTGLPVRVEHQGDQDVGRVVSAQVTPDGRAYVRYSLADTPAGYACQELISKGSLQELSLKHAAYPDGTKRAIEVSLVVKGARPGTNIYANCAQNAADYLGSPQSVAIMASAAAPAEVAPPPAAAAPAAAAPSDEPDAKRARGNDGRFLPAGADTAAAPAQPTEQAPAVPTEVTDTDYATVLPNVLQSISSQVKDPETLKAMYGAVANLMKKVDDTNSEVEKLMQERALLEKAAADNKDNVKTMSRQIARVLDSIYRRHANSQFDDSQAATLEEAMVKFPKLNEALQPIIVAASHVEAELMRHSQVRTRKTWLMTEASGLEI